jgi:polysaccharide biosynthesis transport protein
MTIQDSLRTVRQRWLTVVIVMLIAALTAGATWYLRPKEFTASSTLYVSAQPGYTTQTVLQSTQLSPPVPWSTRMTSYVELLRSPRVSEEVIRQLQLSGITPEDLAKQITASSATDSVVIAVAVTDRSAERAAAIADAVGTAFINLVNELERPASPDAVPPVAVKVVQAPDVPTEPSSLGLPVMLALGVLSGAAVGSGLALARNAFDASASTPAPTRHPMRAPTTGTVNPWAFSSRDRVRTRAYSRTPGTAGRSIPLDRVSNAESRRPRRSAET